MVGQLGLGSPHLVERAGCHLGQAQGLDMIAGYLALTRDLPGGLYCDGASTQKGRCKDRSRIGVRLGKQQPSLYPGPGGWTNVLWAYLVAPSEPIREES